MTASPRQPQGGGPRRLAFAGLALGASLAAQPVLPPARVEFPAPRSPAESLAAITVAPGLRVELVAAEPAVKDPIDVAWDAAGRMWVVEMADYPLGLDAAGNTGGRVRVLESTRGDGRYDRATLFAEGLRYPTSAVPWRDGVLVTAAPDVLFLQDTDGDGRADKTTTLFTGLGEGNQQHLANGLQWDLDGWLHLANGGTRGQIASVRTGATIEMGRDVRIRPDEGLAESLTGRSQFGRNRDDWGNWFGNNNTNPLWHYALEERYLRRNPHLVPVNPVAVVPEVPGAAPVFPLSRTLARFNAAHQSDHFTSACSPLIYRDDFLGAAYAGNAFVCEPVHNLVSRQVLQPQGATFSSRRAPGERAAEFLASTDNWSRFTSVRAGPDGALYVVDMYRRVIEHPKYIPGEWMARLGDLRDGADQGRIYRVLPADRPLRSVPRLDRADTSELAATLAHPAGTVRDLAQQQLVWRGDRAAAPALTRLAREAELPAARAQALWTLALLGGLAPEHVTAALADPHPGVRRQAVRLSERFAPDAPALLERVTRLVDDPDAAVRQQVAYALGEWPDPAAGAALARLNRPGEDRFIVAAAMSSARPHGAALIAALDPAAPVDRSLLELAAATGDIPSISRLLRLTAERPVQSGDLARFLDALARNDRRLPDLARSEDAGLRATAARALASIAAARELAATETAPPAQRTAALALLGRDPAAESHDLDLLANLLTPRHPTGLQLAAVSALRGMSADGVVPRVLAGWAGHGPRLRAALFELLVSRAAWAQALLEHLETERALLRQLDPAQRAALTQHADRAVAERATELLRASVDPDRQKVIDRYVAAVATIPADPGRGAAMFTHACGACHKFGAVTGGSIGPDLAGLADRSAPYLITHVLDPNRVVESRHVLYSAVLNDGRTLGGVLRGESTNSITLVGLDGAEQAILRHELKSLSGTGRSLMPDGLEVAIDPQGMADLIAFLGGAAKAP